MPHLSSKKRAALLRTTGVLVSVNGRELSDKEVTLLIKAVRSGEEKMVSLLAAAVGISSLQGTEKVPEESSSPSV